MPEPFKTLFNRELIEAVAAALLRSSASFNAPEFVERASDGLDTLEMMARADQISHALDGALGGDFLANLQVLVNALHHTKTADLSDMRTDDGGIAGWAIVPLASYVARNGMSHPEQSLDALRDMTMRFSAEFAVRCFWRDHTDVTFAKAIEWARDPNHHVRRLASEGARPLLPWGIKLHNFVDDPTPVLEILTLLRDDPSDYVRKSVANALNDISKDHPDLVAEIAADWLQGATEHRIRLVKHACRTLVKAGHPTTLAAFGFGAPRLADISLMIPKTVKLGDMMPIKFGFTATEAQSLLIDYVLHFMRANGSLSPKVFKWTETTVAPDEPQSLAKSHPYKPVTTRKDYAGTQYVSVQVNGVELAREEFSFLI